MFVTAVKKAEESNEVVVRVVEMRGEAVPNLHVAFAGSVAAAREINGQELPVGPATVANGALETSLVPYGIRTFAVKLAPPTRTLPPIHSVPVDLKYDVATASEDGAAAKSGFDAAGDNLPAEMLPTTLPFNGITFKLGPAWTDIPMPWSRAVKRIPLALGQVQSRFISWPLPTGTRKGTFRVGDKSVDLKIQDWQGYIGQWDNRTWVEHKVELPTPPEPAADDHSWQAERTRGVRAPSRNTGPCRRKRNYYTG